MKIYIFKIWKDGYLYPVSKWNEIYYTKNNKNITKEEFINRNINILKRWMILEWLNWDEEKFDKNYKILIEL